jgi:TPR repeat protein
LARGSLTKQFYKRASGMRSWLTTCVFICLSTAAYGTDLSEVETLNNGLAYFARGLYADAAESLTPLAKHGNRTAQLVLAHTLAAPEYKGRDCSAARHWLRLSAAAGEFEAPWHLARLYDDDACAVRDYLIAIRWYYQAHERGSAEAARRIGEIYLTRPQFGDAGQEAREWFMRGVERFDGVAALHLAEMYEHGIAGARDLSQAFIWYDIAQRILPAFSKEQEHALRKRDVIRELFTPVQVQVLIGESHSRIVKIIAKMVPGS